MAQPPQKSERSTTRKRDNRDIARLVVSGVGLVLLIAFIIGNSTTVKVNFIVFDSHASLIWVILLSAVLGVFVDRLVIVLGRRRKKRAA